MNINDDTDPIKPMALSVPMTRGLKPALKETAKLLNMRPSRLVSEMLIEFLPIIRRRHVEKIKALNVGRE